MLSGRYIVGRVERMEMLDLLLVGKIAAAARFVAGVGPARTVQQPGLRARMFFLNIVDLCDVDVVDGGESESEVCRAIVVMPWSLEKKDLSRLTSLSSKPTNVSKGSERSMN